MKLTRLGLLTIASLLLSPFDGFAAVSRCYDTEGGAVICVAEVMPSIFAAAVNKPDGRQSKAGVPIPTVIVVNCKTEARAGRGVLDLNEIKALANSICKDNRPAQGAI